MIEYKGYIGRVEFDDEAGIFHGEVINTRDVITFEGTCVEEIQHEFRASVDEYLGFCAEQGKAPGNPNAGHLVIDITPESRL
jgi:predicted HicB family RNase H-like nuclease